MNDVVTGSSGFIGSHLVEALESRGREVKRIDKPSYDIREHLGKHVFKDVDTVYHLAALSNIIPSITHPRDYYETNVTGTFNVLEDARLAGVRKIVYAASASCYGTEPSWYGIAQPLKSKFKENNDCNPAYPYALTKYLGEQLVMHYGKVYGMDVVSLRIFNCYGNRSLTKSAYGAMFNTFLAQRANMKSLTIVGDGTQSRDFVYVDDVVEAFILAAEKGNGIYNIGTGVPTTINKIGKIIGGDSIFIPERPGEPHCIYADNARLTSLGWEPKINIERGIGKMLENLNYWRNAKVWELEAIETETREWNKCLA